MKKWPERFKKNGMQRSLLSKRLNKRKSNPLYHQDQDSEQELKKGTSICHI